MRKQRLKDLKDLVQPVFYPVSLMPMPVFHIAGLEKHREQWGLQITDKWPQITDYDYKLLTNETLVMFNSLYNSKEH